MTNQNFFKICCKILFNNYQYLHKFWIRSALSKKIHFTDYITSLFYLSLLISQKGKKILSVRKTDTVSLYYKGLYLFLTGNYSQAQSNLELAVQNNPTHWESYYLLFDCLLYQDKKQEAIQTLLPITFRKKVWLKFANSVENEKDFNLIYNHYKNAVKTNIIKPDNSVVSEYIAMGAQRAKLYDTAINIWTEIVSQPNYSPHKTNKILLCEELGIQAIQDLTQISSQFNIKIFMISGTLLGYIRENSLLKHDSDIDFGIFENENTVLLINTLKKSGLFFIQPQSNDVYIKLRHINGTMLDIFVHLVENNQYYHCTPKAKWYNSFFRLKPIKYKNTSLYIPDNPELYLEENYGPDWKIPKIKFDSVFDCPNGVINNKNEVKIYCIKEKIPFSHE